MTQTTTICAAAKTPQNLTKCSICGVFAARISEKNLRKHQKSVFFRLPFVGNKDASFPAHTRFTLFFFLLERRPGLRLLHRDPEPLRQPAEELLLQRRVQVSAKCIIFCPDSSLVLSKQCPSFRESQYATAVTVSTWPSNQYWVIFKCTTSSMLG